MTATRGATRYPANCPSPCPAGEIILPTAVFSQPSMTFNLDAENAVLVERITQLDFKVTRTFRFNRVSVIPTFEVFNVNNSDAIISYVTTNALSADVSGAQQHHAGPSLRPGRDGALVTRLPGAA